MKIINTKFQGLKIIKGINYYDNRGYFRETFKNSFFRNKNFIFWCMSKSKKNVIRGLHLQKEFRQDKIKVEKFTTPEEGASFFHEKIDNEKLTNEVNKYQHNLFYLTGTNVSTRHGLINYNCGSTFPEVLRK